MSEEGIERFNRQDYAGAVECFIEEMKEALERGDYHEASTYANLIGLSLYFEHYPREALEYFQMAVDYSKEAGTSFDTIWKNMERTRALVEDIEKEISRKKALLEEMEEDTPDRGVLLSNLGVLYYLLGERDTAERYYIMAEEIFRKCGDPLALAAIYNNMGQLYDDMRVLDYHYRALDILEREGHLRGQIDTYYSLAQYYWKSGEWDEAYHFLSKAIDIIDRMERSGENAHSRYVELLRTAADLALRAGKTDEALSLTEKIARCSREWDDGGETPS